MTMTLTEGENSIAAAAVEASTILLPGEYLATLELERPTPRDPVERGLSLMGFSRVAVDENLPPKGGMTASFIGTLSRPIRPISTPAVRWQSARRLESEPFGELHYQLVPFELEEGRLYEILFIARMKAQPTKERVIEVLQAMKGFETSELVALRKDMRIPGHPGTSATLWFGIARWFGPHSHVNMDDPVCFESVIPVEEP